MKISIQHLSKVYPNHKKAIDNVSIEIENGMFGLLGPNGAGKSTLMRILVTLMKPTSGTVRINNYDLQNDRKEIRAMLGYLPQDFGYFSKLKTYEFLDYSAALAGMKNSSKRNKAVESMLEKVGLFEVRNRMANKLSGGMKRRLGIAQALIGEPRIVVVDEPTTGLDPEERIRFRNILSDMADREIIIILSTHIVGDISSTCQNMALLNNGRVVFEGAPGELIDIARGKTWKINTTQAGFERIKEKYPVISTIPVDYGWEVQVVAENTGNYPATPVEPNLEDGYVYFMEYKLNSFTDLADN